MTPGDGQLRSAAYAVLGREFAVTCCRWMAMAAFIK